MRSVKDNLLDKLSAKLGVMYSKMYDDLMKTDTQLDSEHITNLSNLKELFLEAGKMPVWPFDTETLLKFVGSVLFPIILLIVEVFISLYFFLKARTRASGVLGERARGEIRIRPRDRRPARK